MRLVFIAVFQISYQDGVKIVCWDLTILSTKQWRGSCLSPGHTYLVSVTLSAVTETGRQHWDMSGVSIQDWSGW